ncbi:MAG: hypothetical protein U0800_15290 [Isosphaeraceae bacterium]
MPLSTLRWVVSRYPGWVVLAWSLIALSLGLLAPDLTRLAEEGQAHLLPEDCESARADKVVREAWPDNWFQSLAVVALLRPEGLKEEDREYARRLEQAFTTPSEKPEALLRLLGPSSRPEISERLTTPDGTTTSLILQFETAFVQALATGRDDPLPEDPGRVATCPRAAGSLDRATPCWAATTWGRSASRSTGRRSSPSCCC